MFAYQKSEKTRAENRKKGELFKQQDAELNSEDYSITL